MGKSKAPIGFAINPMFKLLLWINSALCVVTLAVMVAIAFSAKSRPPRRWNAC